MKIIRFLIFLFASYFGANANGTIPVMDIISNMFLPDVVKAAEETYGINVRQLEEQYKQLKELENIKDQLLSKDHLMRMGWGDVINDQLKKLAEIEGYEWIGASGVYDIFGGMNAHDIRDFVRNPRDKIFDVALKQSPFPVDRNNRVRTIENGMRWITETLGGTTVGQEVRAGASSVFANILQTSFLTNTAKALESVGALTEATHRLGDELTTETNVHDAMVITSKQTGVISSLLAESIRQNREAHEAMIANDLSETQILQAQQNEAAREARLRTHSSPGR